MKSIFDQTPFGPLTLSLEEQQRFERLAAEILRNVLIEYDHFGPPPATRSFSKNRWKAVKTNENCTAYLDRAARSRTASASATSNSSSSNFQYELSSAAINNPEDSMHSDESGSTADDVSPDDEGADWKMPELVVSGQVPGSLEDVLYGMTTHDSADMMLRTAYVNDNWLDAAVLNQIHLPTAEDPFRFLGIKWYIKGIPVQFQSLVRPRDFTFLEASGILTRPNGARIGYFIRHPVDLAACPDLEHHGMVRGRFVSYSIYTPLPGGQMTDIFVRGKATPAGKMAQAIAISLTAASLLSSSNAVFCSQSKKLTWLLRSAKTAARHRHNGGPLLAETARACRVCRKKFGKLSSVTTCSICSERICSRCRLARSLSFVNTRRKLARVDQIAGVFCKTCIAQANASSAMDIAQQEVLSGRYGPIAKTPASDASGDRATTTSGAAAAVHRCVSDASEAATLRDHDDEYDDDDDVQDAEGTGHEWVPAIPYAGPVDHTQQQQQLGRQELWRKMAELRAQAEDVYQLTKKTSDLHLTAGAATHSASNSIETYDSEVDDLD